MGKSNTSEDETDSQPLSLPSSGSSKVSTPPSVSYFRLFDGVSRSSKVSLIAGVLSAAAYQIMTATYPLFMGRIFDELARNEKSSEEIYKEVCWITLIWAILGVAVCLSIFVAERCFTSVAQEVGYLYRTRYLHALLNKNISYFDTHKTSELPQKMIRDCRQMESGAGIHLLLLVSAIFYSVVVLFSFFISPQLALISLCLAILIAGLNTLCVVMMSRKLRTNESAYAKVSGIADESLSELKTVAAYTAEDHFAERYEAELEEPLAQEQQATVLKGLAKGVGVAGWMVVTAVIFWSAAEWLDINAHNWIWGDSITGTDAFIIFWYTVILAHLLGNFNFSFQKCIDARNACARAIRFIEEPVNFDNGSLNKELEGKANFSDIHFAYPTRRDKVVLNGVSFTCEKGQRTAIVGESGEGKSTLLQLLERFYEPESGVVLFDGVPARDFEIHCLRGQIGYVSQEPILFNLTIKENILLGKPSASAEEVVVAAQAAHAMEFISQLEAGLDTEVGLKGSSLSAGQKQRVAIARALVRKPKILLLDEATSAIDHESEEIILDSLNTIHATFGITMISVAQKLSTTQNYDKIVVLREGKVHEQGNHEELCAANGYYKSLWTGQQHSSTKSAPSTRIHSVDGDSDLKGISAPVDYEETQTTNSCSAFCRLSGALARYWPLGIVCVIATIAAGFTYPLMAYFIAKMITYTVGYTSDIPDYIVDELVHKIRACAMEILLFGGAAFLCFFIMEVSFGLIVARMKRRLRSNVYRSMLNLDATYMDCTPHCHETLNFKLDTDVEVVSSAGAPFVSTVLLITVAYFAAVTMAFYWEWRMGLLVMILLPIQAYLSAVGAENLKIFEAREENQKATAIIVDSARNIKTIAAYQTQPQIESRVALIYSGDIAETSNSRILVHVKGGISLGINAWCFALTFWYANYLMKGGHVDIESMAMAVYACSFTAQGIYIILWLSPNFLEGVRAAGRIYEVIDYKPKVNTLAEGGLKTPIQGEIAFQEVAFSYPSRNRQILKNISFDVKAGMRIGFAGPSGSGKSTIIQLILRLYDSSEGIITIDGVDIRQYDVKHLRQSIALVSQEPVLFSGTIRSNVDFGAGKSDEEIREALRQAAMSRFVEDLNREVGIRGGMLSGGQKQRMAVARALLRSPSILLLDEATSALDSLTEKRVSQALEAAGGNKTVLTVAHRISTLEKCDFIFVLNSGHIVEQGTHQDLYSRSDSLYYTLFAQSRSVK